MPNNETLYCSLDLELTGFDPTRDTILEVGFVFFRPTPNGLDITEQWSQTFRPLTSVHPKILGLTGLTQSELDASPSFAEFREFLQDKLKDVVLVGHNIIVDAGFLEAFGIKLSGRTIDTLDLVQFLLPTHHSYNLENLMHYFQIPHPDAHRALADSIAVVNVLEKLRKVFGSLSPALQSKALELATSADFAWVSLFENIPQGTPPATENTAKTQVSSESIASFTPDTVRVFPYGSNTLTIPSVDSNDTKTLLVVSDKQRVLELWKGGLLRGVFPPQDLFNEAKFEKFLERTDLAPDEIKFALKILIWKEVNWQHSTILDLNLTFFGGQFRNYISPSPIPKTFDESVLGADFATLEYITENVKVNDRRLLLSSAHEFERDLSSGKERRLSWQRFLYVFRSLEWSESNDSGVAPETISAAITATDLFFGLVAITVQRNFSQYSYLSLADLVQNERANTRIREAARSYIEKISKLFSDHVPVEVSRLLKSLENFFANNPDYIKWIETSQTNCTFFNQPLHILSDSHKILEAFESVSVNEDFSHPVLDYLLARLGMDWFKIIEQENDYNAKKISLQTIDLKADGLNKALFIENLPAAVVMGSPQEIKEFYNSHYDGLKEYATLYAQGYSGGSNKIIRNFGIKPESILFVTGGMLLGQDGRRLKPKTLVITEFPKENLNHPYVKALREYWEKRFPDIGAVLNAYLLYRLLKTCLHDGLETIYISVPRNDTERYLYETLQKLPFVTSSPQT